MSVDCDKRPDRNALHVETDMLLPTGRLFGGDAAPWPEPCQHSGFHFRFLALGAWSRSKALCVRRHLQRLDL